MTDNPQTTPEGWESLEIGTERFPCIGILGRPQNLGQIVQWLDDFSESASSHMVACVIADFVKRNRR